MSALLTLGVVVKLAFVLVGIPTVTALILWTVSRTPQQSS